MSDLSDLYQEVILDHNRSPRNHGRPEGANRESEGYNPLCGDRLTVYLRMSGDRVEDVGFQGAGCAISQASASVMTTVLKGKTRPEVEALVDRFQKLVTGRLEPGDPAEDLGDGVALAGVSQFPARVKCATLGWHTAAAALRKADEPVSTE